MGVIKTYLAAMAALASARSFHIDVNKFMRWSSMRLRGSPFEKSKRYKAMGETVIRCGFRNKSLVRIFSRPLTNSAPKPVTKIGLDRHGRGYRTWSDGSVRRA